MDQMDSLLDVIGAKLDKVAKSEAVVGEAVTLGGVTLVPISRLSIGLGGGGGTGEGEGQAGKGGTSEGSGKGSGVGSGGAARVRPVAVVAFTAAGVEVLPVPDKKGKLDRIIDKIPEWVERFDKKSAS